MPATIAVVGTAGLCPVVLRVLRRRRMIDVPNMRSSHVDPTPRGGGSALALPIVVAALLSRGMWPVRLGLLIAAVPMALLGLIEDARGIPIGRRFGGQILIGVLAVPFLLQGAHLTSVDSALAAVLGVVWLVAFVNAFNFMDGINGVAGAEVIVAGATYAWLGRGRFPVLVDGGLIAAGAAVGFLPFNFPRARMFLGDVGSYLLGAWLAVLAALALRYRLGAVAAAAPLALYLGDTGITLLRRIVKGEQWRQPHRTHVYQRLVAAGWSHTTVTLVIAVVSAACSFLGVAARGRPFSVQAGLGAAIVALVLGYVGLPWLTRSAQVVT